MSGVPPVMSDWLHWSPEGTHPSPDLVARLEAAVSRLEELTSRGKGQVRIYQPEDVEGELARMLYEDRFRRSQDLWRPLEVSSSVVEETRSIQTCGYFKKLGQR